MAEEADFFGDTVPPKLKVPFILRYANSYWQTQLLILHWCRSGQWLLFDILGCGSHDCEQESSSLSIFDRERYRETHPFFCHKKFKMNMRSNSNAGKVQLCFQKICCTGQFWCSFQLSSETLSCSFLLLCTLSYGALCVLYNRPTQVLHFTALSLLFPGLLRAVWLT